MFPNSITTFSTTCRDYIPIGRFEASLPSDQISGILFSVQVGRAIQADFPSVASDYRNGLSYNAIVKKYDLQSVYSIKSSTARSAVRYSIIGYKAGDEGIAKDEPCYLGLITDQDELSMIAHAHNVATGRITGIQARAEGKGIFSLSSEARSQIGRESGKKQFENKIGIHAQTKEYQIAMGRALAKAQGKILLSDDEIASIQKMVKDPEYQRKSRINAKKISEALNIEFHNGKPVRNQRCIVKFVCRTKK